MVIKKRIVKVSLRKPAPQLSQPRQSTPPPPPTRQPLMKPLHKVQSRFTVGKKPLNRNPEAAQRPAAPAKRSASKSNTAEQVRDYFASVLSKDIRPKVGYFAESIGKLREGGLGILELGKMLDEMEAGVQEVSQTIDDLLSISLLGSGGGGADVVAAETDVTALVSDVVNTFRGEAAAKGVSISAKVESMPTLEIDAHRIRLVVRGLVDNAVKFTSFGRIGVIVSYFAEKLKIVVEDTGCGIPPESQAKFAEFGFGAGVDDGHTSTGLAMVERLVYSMNGELKFRSTPGIGTVMTVVMPNVRAAAGSARAMSSLQKIGTISIRPQAPTASKILVVVNSPAGAAVLVGMLNSIGYRNVETAPNGAQGLVKLLTGMFDFVFTDVEMPEMDGRTLIREIRRIPTFSELPVFALTASDAVGEECADLNFTGVILAPLTPDKLQYALC